MTNLDAALDAAAPDGGSWIEGKNAYHAALANGASEQDALDAALDAAAPDGDSWIEGQHVYWLDPNELKAYSLGLRADNVPPSRGRVLLERVKTNFKTLTLKAKRPTTHTEGHS